MSSEHLSTASSVEHAASQQRAGVAYALAAYVFWGVAPVYFVWVDFALPLEVLAHRVVWSLPLLAILIVLGRQWETVRALQRRDFFVLAACAGLLSVNWLTFIYAIQQHRIVETSLGYFINPLISIVLGAVFLKEKMRPLQWCAAGAATLGVGCEVFALGDLPWLGLVLAFTFGFYGLLRKQLSIPSSIGLGIETAMVAPLAIAFLFYMAGAAEYPTRSLSQIMQLSIGGMVTVVPLIWFAAAAIRLPLTMLGFFQYVAPSLSLIIAVFIYDEIVPGPRWLSFALIWLGLVIFSMEGLYHHRRSRLGGVE